MANKEKLLFQKTPFLKVMRFFHDHHFFNVKYKTLVGALEHLYNLPYQSFYRIRPELERRGIIKILGSPKKVLLTEKGQEVKDYLFALMRKIEQPEKERQKRLEQIKKELEEVGL